MKQKTFPTLKILATAVAAYEHNDRTIVRNSVVVGNRGYVSNRQLISDYVQGLGGPFIVNDVHHKQAEGIVQYLEQTVILQSLKGTPDGFLSQLSTILANKEASEIGIIAWAPHLVDQYQKKDHAREISSQFEYRSNFIGKVGEKVDIDFTIIEKRYVQSTDCYAVYGVSGNNLVFYWANKLDKVCEVGRIHGRVKAHNKDERRNGARVTTLNYVKVL